MGYLKTFKLFENNYENPLDEVLHKLLMSISRSPSVKHLIKKVHSVQDTLKVYGIENMERNTEMGKELKELKNEIDNSYDITDAQYLKTFDDGLQHAPNSTINLAINILKRDSKSINESGKLLSNNHYGKVYKTSSSGFSPKVIMSQLEKLFKEIDVDIVNYSFAKTGTIYLQCWSEKHLELDNFDIRISNHTKRGELIEYVDTLSYSFVDSTLSDVEILNNEMKEETFEYFNKFKNKNILEFKKSDLAPTNSFEVNDNLNPEVWDEFNMKTEVREKLLEIANEFINTIHGDFVIYDIVLIGSLAGYNWSKYSDFDIHIVIDYTDINDDFDLVEEYVDLLGKKWNKNYEILIHDYEVELYIEDKNVSREHINGLYSILKDKWVIHPTSNKDQTVDTKLIELKAVNIMEQIDAMDTKSSKISYNILKDESDKIWDKIKKARRDGINSPDGEYAVGNLVFKYLRRNGYIGKIINIKKKLVETKFSL